MTHKYVTYRLASVEQQLTVLNHSFCNSLLSIQVDGGSEFMDEFKEACIELNISLFVLPPMQSIEKISLEI